MNPFDQAWALLKDDFCPECAGSGWSLDGQHCDYCNAEPVEVPTATNENVPQELTPETIEYLQNTPPKMGKKDALDDALQSLNPKRNPEPTWRKWMSQWRENKRDRLRGRDE